MTSSTTSELAGAAAAAAILLASSLAPAQPAQGDPVAAQALFKEARELVDKGNWAAGCPKFEASLALQGSASTMLNIAKCHEHAGKIASAWDAYNRALTLNAETKGESRKKGLEALAKKGIDALTPRLPKLRITVQGAPAGLKVLRDGKEIPAAALGDALPADPGAHEIQASAPGFRTETRSVTLEEGKVADLSITLVPGASPEAPAPEAPASRGVPIWAWISGAAGLALSGVAVYFLVDDLAAIRALRANCMPLAGGGGYACDPHYDYHSDDARKNRDFPLTVALGGVGLAALGAAVGGIVLGMSPKRQEAPKVGVTVLPWVASGGAGAVLVGAF